MRKITKMITFTKILLESQKKLLLLLCLHSFTKKVTSSILTINNIQKKIPANKNKWIPNDILLKIGRLPKHPHSIPLKLLIISITKKSIGTNKMKNGTCFFQIKISILISIKENNTIVIFAKINGMFNN